MPAERPDTDGARSDLAGSGEPLYVVRVHDSVDARIAGHSGYVYASPPAPRGSAVALVALLLGDAAQRANGASAWTRAVPGGRRTITLAPANSMNRRAVGSSDA
jgi:hypothetical protein